jgi:hypothetical protein
VRVAQTFPAVEFVGRAVVQPAWHTSETFRGVPLAFGLLQCFPDTAHGDSQRIAGISPGWR